MSATAIAPIRWCSFRTQAADGCRRRLQPGLQTAPGLIVYRYGADLFYANADHFADQVRELVEKAPSPAKWLLLDAEAIGDVDLSAAQTVRSLLEDLKRRGVRVVIGRANPYLLSDIRRHRIAAVIGEGQIFPTLHEAIDVIRAERPRKLIRRKNSRPACEPPAVDFTTSSLRTVAFYLTAERSFAT